MSQQQTDERHEDGIEDMQAALRGLNGLVEGSGWDQLPSVWAVIRKDGTNLAVAELPPVGFETGHPSDVLAGLADTMKKARALVNRPTISGLFALVFVCESWAVIANDPTKIERDMAAARKRQLHKRRDRVETRVISAVDATGVHYTFMVPRHEEAMDVMETAGRPDESHEGAFATGYVHESLARMLEAMI